MDPLTLPPIADEPESVLPPLPEFSPEALKEHTTRYENNGKVVNLVPTFYRRGEKRKNLNWYLAPNPSLLTSTDYQQLIGEDETKQVLAAYFSRNCQEAFEENEDSTTGVYDKAGVVAYLQRGPIRMKLADIRDAHRKAASLLGAAMNEMIAKGISIVPGSEQFTKLTTLHREVSKWQKLYDAKSRRNDDVE